MRISILTLFPEMFSGPFDSSIIARAQKKHAVSIELVNLRDFSTDRYHSVDDHPYGGGAGMILRVDVIDRAVTTLRGKQSIVVLLDPQGTVYTQKTARSLSECEHLILICGHYEGIDERVRSLVDEEISIGDFITTGGEIPAMLLVDSLVRLLPGVLAKPEASVDESFTENRLEYPQYTRPETHGGIRVPAILLSGNHKNISDWRKSQSLTRTKKRRPDLIGSQRKGV